MGICSKVLMLSETKRHSAPFFLRSFYWEWISLPNWQAVLRRCLRGGVEFSQFEALQAILKDVVLSNQRDSWKWSLDVSTGFSVASVRHLVDSRFLVVDQIATRWNRCVPIKINVFLWRLSRNKLPSRITQPAREGRRRKKNAKKNLENASYGTTLRRPVAFSETIWACGDHATPENARGGVVVALSGRFFLTAQMENAWYPEL
ncbi:RNA-directed DNA polymerase, eukaryota, Reverse transcriptase zinc-binding domain protein [Artemisia annua]|uniref:RNA-directed DNA polymerase, eukaryota, Reverse transcriptase zinc-binding domain protein n=1 Tax=Artemisia annua TaxID=35608 RepID=A0A2U1NEA9_ARTAN|nr:RNA-directed DNA polymerase, eukaryota, Reverse transcriptase zinc-binding domain protein [Artemisia annua]